jgi:hypothetical protein
MADDPTAAIRAACLRFQAGLREVQGANLRLQAVVVLAKASFRPFAEVMRRATEAAWLELVVHYDEVAPDPRDPRTFGPPPGSLRRHRRGRRHR